MGSVGGSALLRRSPARLEGMAFAFSENGTKVTLLDPAQVENAIVPKAMIFGRSDRWGRDNRSQEEPGKKKKIYPASVHPPVHPPLTPEQVGAMLAARDLPEGPVVKQLLEWIAELENRQSEKK